MFTFLHAADLHLDSPLIGLERYGDAPADELRGATRRALENLVELAIDESVAFVLLAGDLYDGEWKDYNTGLFFARQMARLKDADIPVFVVAGNHDAASQITRALRTPDNVVRFGSARAESRRVPGRDDIVVHGRSFATRHVSDDLSARYPDPEPGCFHVGLLHTSLDGREGHAPYAPCTVDGLRAKGYDYWALGHVHEREVVAQDPWIVFPGNTQGRHARELRAKGCTLVRVDDGAVHSVEARPLDVVRWDVRPVDVSQARDLDDVLEAVARDLDGAVTLAEGRTLAARVDLTGVSAAHGRLAAHPEHVAQQIRALAVDRFGERVWVEKVRVRTRAPARTGSGVAADGGGGDSLTGLVRSLEEMQADDRLIEDLASAFKDLREKLPAEVVDSEGPEALDVTNPDHLKGLTVEARDLLVARLTGEEG